MSTLIVALLSGVGFVVAYHTYGRWLARKIFGLDPKAPVPSEELNDGVDYVPTRREVVFGHHFTSIAGTGPIVGPAIAVFWGWLPALLWVVFGSIFVGAVHDFGSMVVSLRSRGQTIGDVAGRMISRRARILFLFILFMALTVVIGVFGLVIAVIFSVYPQTVLSVWIEIPIAIGMGWLIFKKSANLKLASLGALFALYFAVYLGVYHLPISLESLFGIPLFAGPEATLAQGLLSSVVIWTFVLLIYCFIASTLPVWTLLQPRDYINSHQLMVALALLILGLVFAHPEFVAPAVNRHAPGDAPPIFPFLFITIACGAISGFHCLVASGTSSKQLANEKDAQFVSYGAMLLEGGLAVLVIIACTAGLGLGIERDGALLTGAPAWSAYYGESWTGLRLVDTVGAFVHGGANLIASLGLPLPLCLGIIAVMVASFAATTLDTATRLQRYVLQELGASLNVKPLSNKYIATAVAVGAGGAIALISGPNGPGSGGLILWPLFGATNQLLAGLAFMVIAFYLLRHGKSLAFLVVPGVMMLVLPAWAMSIQILGWIEAGNWLLVAMGAALEFLQLWMILEAALTWKRARGVLPEPLPPLQKIASPAGAAPMGVSAVAVSAGSETGGS